MNGDRFDIRWVGYHPESNKIWGWFVDLDREPIPMFPRSSVRFKESFCFWAVPGKTISMNKHMLHGGNMERLERVKISRGYGELKPSEINSMWPTISDDIATRMVYYTLRGDF